MLFETAQKKTTGINNTAPRKQTPQVTRPTAKPATAMQTRPKIAKTSPVLKKQLTPGTAYSYIKKPIIARTGLKPVVRTITRPITGRVGTRPIIRPTTTISRSAQPRKVYKYATTTRPLQKRSYYAGTQLRPAKAIPPSQGVQRRRVYRGPLVVRRGQPIPGRRVYYSGTRTQAPSYTAGTAKSQVYINRTTNRPVRYVEGYGYCTPQPPASSVPVTAGRIQQSVPTTSSAPIKKPVCHYCGTSGKGCTTLSRFAFNSSQLKASHKNLIRELAMRILRDNINAVIATGHTDHSGTEDYNEALGARRAEAVIRELRKQLSLLKPNAHRNLLWRIDSRGETRPISKTDAAANRRVHVCVRQAKF